MGDWSYLSKLLDKVQAHSTVVGKVWMTVLFLFRILVLGAAAENAWGDERSEFYCHTEEPGCSHACYDWMFPVSYARYWVLQIVFVSTPTLVYLGHALHVVHTEKRLRQRLQLQSSQTNGGSAATPFLKQPKYTDDRGKVTIKGVLLRSYLTQLVFKILLEVAFAVGQFYIFGGLYSIFVPNIFHCQREPCPKLSGVECYVSRNTEKSIFIVFMLAVAGVSALLNVVEIIYLLCARKGAADKKVRAQQHLLVTSQQLASSHVWSASVNNRHGGSGAGGALYQPSLPQDLVDICSDNTVIDLVNKEKRT